MGGGHMPTIKESVMSLLKEMPEDSTLEDIMETLYIKQKILKGQRQLESGQFYTHEEAKEIMKQWLK
jgi:predicted transcriptional regulator